MGVNRCYTARKLYPSWEINDQIQKCAGVGGQQARESVSETRATDNEQMKSSPVEIEHTRVYAIRLK